MFCLGALFGDYDHDRPSRTRDKPIPGRLVADIRVGEQSGKACRDLRCGNWAAWRGKKVCLLDRPFSPYRPNTHLRTRVSIENFCQVTVTLKARDLGCSVWGLRSRQAFPDTLRAHPWALGRRHPCRRTVREGLSRSPRCKLGDWGTKEIRNERMIGLEIPSVVSKLRGKPNEMDRLNLRLAPGVVE